MYILISKDLLIVSYYYLMGCDHHLL